MTDTDWGSLYREHVQAIGALASSLDDVQLAVVVPGSPSWTVHEVLAHLAGGPADAVNDRTEGAPGAEWTERHVAERRTLPVATIIDELRSNVDFVAASTVDNPRPAVVWDIAVHHADLHEALGLGTVPERFWRPVADAVGPMMAPELVGEVPAYELFRGIFSRRSRTQMAAWGTGLDAERLDALCVFGPRDDDQPVPDTSGA